MTDVNAIKEAIDALTCGFLDVCDIDPYMDTILRTLEKRVPKKITHEATLYRCCTCPSCKNVVDEFIEFRGKRTLVQVSNCKYCGQALLWEDIECEEENK